MQKNLMAFTPREIVPTEYECNICKDRGFVPTEDDKFDGYCVCRKIKQARHYLKHSNLEHVIKKYQFENYTTEQEWQNEYKQRAMKFVKEPKGWFTFLANSGVGKTHLMSAITIHLIGQGKQGLYIKWRNEMVKAKSNYWNMDQKLFKQMLEVEVLYLDDFLKMRDLNTIHDSEFEMAVTIIDMRSVNPNLITLISSEWSVQELNAMDTSLAGRIVELSGGMKSPNLINAPTRKDDNYRFR